MSLWRSLLGGRGGSGAAQGAEAGAADSEAIARRWIWLLAAITLFAYWPVRFYPYIDYDDPFYIIANPHVARGFNLDAFWWGLTAFRNSNWHPLTWWSHQVDVSLFGLSAGPQHLVNVAWHLAAGLLLFGWLRREVGRLHVAGVIAGLFLIHPLHLESVVWLSERKDVISAAFWMATCLAYSIERRRLALILFALGLLAKPMLVSLPLVLLLIELWRARRRDGDWAPDRSWFSRQLRALSPFILLSVASCVVTFVAQRSGGAVKSVEQFPIVVRLGNAVVAAATYLWQAVWPAKLAVFYPHPQRFPALTEFCLALLTLGALSAIAWLGRKRFPVLLFGWGWYLVTLVPVIGLIQVGEQAHADRYTYIPLVGPSLALVLTLFDLIGTRHRVSTLSGAGAVLLLLLASTRVQIVHWSSSFDLFKRAIEVTGENWLAEYNLGTALLERGEVESAYDYLSRSDRHRPNDPATLTNLGQALDRMGRRPEARRSFEAAVAADGRFAMAWVNLGAVQAEAGELEQAMESFRRAVEADSSQPRAHFNLGKALVLRGRLDEARSELTLARDLDPRDLDAAQALEALGAPAR